MLIYWLIYSLLQDLFCLFIIFMGFSRQECSNCLSFLSPVDPFLSQVFFIYFLTKNLYPPPTQVDFSLYKCIFPQQTGEKASKVKEENWPFMELAIKENAFLSKEVTWNCVLLWSCLLQDHPYRRIKDKAP